MTIKDKLNIYNILRKNFDVGQPVLLCTAGELLSSHGVTPAKYGYEKMLPMISDLSDILKVSSKPPRPGAPPVHTVKLLPLPPEVDESLPDKSTADIVIPAATPTTASTAGALAELPPDRMTEQTIVFPWKTQSLLSDFITGGHDTTLTPELLAQVQDDYEAAFKAKALNYDATHDNYSFALTAKTYNGKDLTASVRRSDRPGCGWLLNYIGIARRPKPAGALCRFAFLGKIPEFLQNLADHAQEETWDFTGQKSDRSILKQYINYTFYRLEQEKNCVLTPLGDLPPLIQGYNPAVWERIFLPILRRSKAAKALGVFAAFARLTAVSPVNATATKPW